MHDFQATPDQVSALRSAVLILSRRLRNQRAGGELSPSEIAVLAKVVPEGITPGDLARQEHVRPPSMTRTIEALERKGFVTRQQHPHDRRQVLVTRTPAGDDYILLSRQIRTAWLGGQVGKLPEQRRAELLAAIDALTLLANQE